MGFPSSPYGCVDLCISRHFTDFFASELGLGLVFFHSVANISMSVGVKTSYVLSDVKKPVLLIHPARLQQQHAALHLLKVPY